MAFTLNQGRAVQPQGPKRRSWSKPVNESVILMFDFCRSNAGAAR
jgi:hypothetical protein